MGLEQIAQINISLSTAAVTRKGFGRPLFLTHNVPGGFTSRARLYSKSTDMISDGFSSTHPAVKAVRVMESQEVHPPDFLVGRAANAPTQRFKITPVAVNLAVYELWVNGIKASFTADASATGAEIVTGLVASINALSQGTVTVTNNTTYLTVTASGTGVFNSLLCDMPQLMDVIQDHADAGLSADLDAIALENGDFYYIQYQFNSAACVAAIDAWAEANQKKFYAQVQDNACETTTKDGSITDVGETLYAANLNRTQGLYSRETDDFLDAGLIGFISPKVPGSETNHLRMVKGVPTYNYTANQKNNLTSRRLTYLADFAGLAATFGGRVSSGEWADIIRGRDHTAALMQEDISNLLITEPGKLPLTDEGIERVRLAIAAVIAQKQRDGFLAYSPAPVITVPLASEISSVDRGNRVLNGITFTAQVQGAVHFTTITGTFTA
jgi:hypothetical protein